MTDLHGRLREALDVAARATAGTPLEGEVASTRTRLDGPLRLAIAGRVKAGKSTLLNALVGERLAPTDAGECTRVVTWYREGTGYAVRGVLAGGAVVELPFDRGPGALQIDLGGRTAADFDRIEVEWPSSALRRVTLIDTPGLASIDDSASARTERFLGVHAGAPSGADAVIYLMRHLHRRDAEFLDAFKGRPLSEVSPVNAVAVLSRADEVGACRIDAIDSARRIAARYQHDERVRTLCGEVVAVAGLLAETGLTLREDEVAALRSLAALPPERLDDLLLSVERFVRGEAGGVAPGTREHLLARLGLFGVRLSLDLLGRQHDLSAPDLARALVDASGLAGLRQVIEERFVPRAAALQARSALAVLASVARRLEERDPAAARALASEVESIEAGAHVFEELRLAHVVLAGDVRLGEDEVAEVRRMTSGAPVPLRLGLADGAAGDQVRQVALAGVERWRARAAEPLASPALRDAAEVMARSYEAAYADAG